MSETLNQYTLTGAIVGADEFLGPNRVWTPENEFQRALIERHFAGPKRDLPALEKLDLMVTKASNDAAVLNKLLAERGFTIQLDAFAPNEFGTVSILEMLVGWLAKGREAKVTGARDGVEYEAAHLPKACRVEFYVARDKQGDVVEFAAVPAVFGLGHQDAADPNAPPPQPDVMVYMAPMDTAPSGFGLIELAIELSRGKHPYGNYEGLIFPMVSLDHKPDIGAVKGLHTVNQNGMPWEISQALQQNILKMNHLGALAKSATALGMRCLSMPRPPKVIDRPFLVWFEIDGMAEPLFVAHVAEDAFKNPGDLV